jgi:hypothetical protein
MCAPVHCVPPLRPSRFLYEAAARPAGGAGRREGFWTTEDILDILRIIMSKVLVSLDDRLLKRIDRAAKSRGLTRSAYLAALAEGDFAHSEGPGKDPSVRAALRELERMFADAPPGDSTAWIRADRDSR